MLWTMWHFCFRRHSSWWDSSCKFQLIVCGLAVLMLSLWRAVQIFPVCVPSSGQCVRKQWLASILNVLIEKLEPDLCVSAQGRAQEHIQTFMGSLSQALNPFHHPWYFLFPWAPIFIPLHIGLGFNDLIQPRSIIEHRESERQGYVPPS